MKLLWALLLLCALALCEAQRGDFNDHVGFPRNPNENRPTRPGRPERPTPPSTTPRNPGVDGAGALIGCNCPSTPEFNSVCGTDGNTYGNMGKLRCAQRCGHNVQLAFLGNCRNRA